MPVIEVNEDKNIAEININYKHKIVSTKRLKLAKILTKREWNRETLENNKKETIENNKKETIENNNKETIENINKETIENINKETIENINKETILKY